MYYEFFLNFFLHFKLFLLDEAGLESFEHKINELHTEKIMMGGEYCGTTVCLGYFVE